MTVFAIAAGFWRDRFVFASEAPHNQVMTPDEFAELRPGDLVECAGVERRILEHHGHALSLSDDDGVLTVPRTQADKICLLRRADARDRTLDAEWNAVAKHLHLVNLVRARIGQRALDRGSGYSPKDIKADAEFYAATQTWARQRAIELGVIEGKK